MGPQKSTEPRLTKKNNKLVTASMAYTAMFPRNVAVHDKWHGWRGAGHALHLSGRHHKCLPLLAFSFVCSLQQHSRNSPKSPAPLRQRLAVLFGSSLSSSDKPIKPISPQPRGNLELGLKANISQSLLRDTSFFHGQS